MKKKTENLDGSKIVDSRKEQIVSNKNEINLPFFPPFIITFINIQSDIIRSKL